MIIAAEVLLMASIVACGIALCLNASIVGSLGAYVSFAIAFGTAGFAALLLTGAASQLGFCGPPSCEAASREASTMIGLAAGFLWSALASVAPLHWLASIPFAGTPMIIVFGMALGLAVTSIYHSFPLMRALAQCLAEVPPPSAQTAAVLVSILIFLGIVSLLAWGLAEAVAGKESKGSGID